MKKVLYEKTNYINLMFGSKTQGEFREFDIDNLPENAKAIYRLQSKEEIMNAKEIYIITSIAKSKEPCGTLPELIIFK